MASSGDSYNSIYTNPHLAAHLDSFEGVPVTEWPEPVASPAERAARTPWQSRVVNWMNDVGVKMAPVSPGIVLALLLAIAGAYVADWIGKNLLGYAKDNPVSPILIAVVLGLAIRNAIGLPDVYEKGLRLCVKLVLRIGVALLGIRLSLGAIGQIGIVGLPIVIICIATALIAVTMINNALGLPKRLGSLIAVGTSICGVSAIVATAPVINADDDETSYAVATIALFGMIALFAYPFLAHWLFAADPKLAGVFLGTAIHDTSQVAGAALTYQQQYGAPEALNSAVVTKLVRNLCMVGVIPLMSLLYHRSDKTNAGKSAGIDLKSMVPLFVIMFVVMAMVRTIGDLGDKPFGFMSHETWELRISQTKFIAEWCLAIAMAAVGLGTSLRRLRSLGIKPFCVGFAAALCVGGVSVILVKLLGGFM